MAVAFAYPDIERLIARRRPDWIGPAGTLPVNFVADYLGVNRASVLRWRAVGSVTARTADRLATALGTHAAIVWPDAWATANAQADAKARCVAA